MFAYLYDAAKTISLFNVGRLMVGHHSMKHDTPIDCVIKEPDGCDAEIYVRFDSPNYCDKFFLIPVEEIVNCQSGPVNKNLSSKRYVSGNIDITVDDGRNEHNPIKITLLKENVESMKELYNYWSNMMEG